MNPNIRMRDVENRGNQWKGVILSSEDSVVLQRIKKGECGAYEILVRKYHRHLLNFIFRIVRDESIVEDIGQDVFISVYRALSGFDERRGVPFSAWLFIVARNRCISELRKKKRIEFVPIFETYPAHHSIAPDEEIIRKEHRNAIEKALEKLEEPFRTSIVQSLEGSTIDQIATSCAVPVNTVKTRLYRARNKLKRFLHYSEDG